jgi:hypothetical protein
MIQSPMVTGLPKLNMPDHASRFVQVND